MEKKNVIFLSVIAVATLLTAVIGTTFAYFTANITTSNAANSNTTVKTKTIANAVLNMGDKVEGTNVLPGFKTVKPITLVGSGADDAQPANTVITVTPSIPEAFGNDVTWKLYESTTPITCTDGDEVTTGTQYYDTDTCTIPATATAVIDNGGTAAKSYDKTVTPGSTTNYYLVVEYANNNDQTATQSGQSFSIDLSFARKAD